MLRPAMVWETPHGQGLTPRTRASEYMPLLISTARVILTAHSAPIAYLCRPHLHSYRRVL